VPEKAATVASPAEPWTGPRFRRPADGDVQRAARRLVRGSKAAFSSQAEFRSALVTALRRDEPLATISGRRMRRLLIALPGVRLSVRYRERPDSAPLTSCPVCGSPLKPIRNQTLAGESIVLGQRCTRCDYWTHRTRRVPVRYLISSAGIDGRAFR
jgi:hypothetical protein